GTHLEHTVRIEIVHARHEGGVENGSALVREPRHEIVVRGAERVKELAGGAVEDDTPSDLARVDEYPAHLTVDGKVHQHALERRAIPRIVRHDLVVPHPLTRIDVQGEDGVRVERVARTA